MRIVRAQAMGLCFGVRDALAVTQEHPDPTTVTVWGELVHNEVVQTDLQRRGFVTVPEAARGTPPAADRDAVLITAHGVSNAERQRLATHGKTIIDTTCPLVHRAHAAAQRLEADGRLVIVIGRPGHVEVEGLIGDLRHAVVLRDADEARHYAHPALGVLCQTTCTEERAAAALDAIRRHNPGADIRFVDTICEPTKQRIRAARALAGTVDAAVVVGGHNSNNTRQLAELFRARGVPAHHVQGPEDLDPAWFDGVDAVGLTAGTSTLDATIDSVEARLRRIAEPRHSK